MKQLLVVAVVALVVATRAQDTPPDTVDELDATKYVGRWYQASDLHANYLLHTSDTNSQINKFFFQHNPRSTGFRCAAVCSHMQICVVV